MMKVDIKEAWVKKLESGEYEQVRNKWGGKGYGDQSVVIGYCCLQLLREEVLGLNEKNSKGYERDLSIAGLGASQVKDLVNMNDTELKTFPEIAQWVRENVPVTS